MEDELTAGREIFSDGFHELLQPQTRELAGGCEGSEKREFTSS